MNTRVSTTWRKSSYSTSASNCVEINFAQQIRVRDSKNPLPTLTFRTSTWSAFLTVLN